MGLLLCNPLTYSPHTHFHCQVSRSRRNRDIRKPRDVRFSVYFTDFCISPAGERGHEGNQFWKCESLLKPPTIKSVSRSDFELTFQYAPLLAFSQTQSRPPQGWVDRRTKCDCSTFCRVLCSVTRSLKILKFRLNVVVQPVLTL